MNLLPATTLSGDNRIHVCKAETLLRALPSGSVDLIVTSPPYDNLRKYKGFSWNFEYIAQQSYRVLKQGGVLVWVVADGRDSAGESFTSFYQASYFRHSAKFTAWQTLIYEKDGMPFPPQKRYYTQHEYMFVFSKGEPSTFNGICEPNKNAGRQLRVTNRQSDGSTKQSKVIEIASEKLLSSVWRISAGYMRTTKDREAYEHPAMFPEELARRHIVTWSNEGDTVLDFFMGSGTTAKMAALNNRRFIGCDQSAEYVAIARERVRRAQSEARQLELIA